MKINWWPFAIVIYTDNLPETVGGRTNYFIVRIRPKYEKDVGIHKHELKHVSFNWMGLLVFTGLLSTFYKPFRLWDEAQAYKEQMLWPDADGNRMALNEAARRLSSGHYGDITMDEARAALQS